VVSRPLEGEAPTIDLVIGYNKSKQLANFGTFPFTPRSAKEEHSGNCLIVGAMLTVFSGSKPMAPLSPKISKIDRSMPIVAETEQVSSRRISPLNSRARI
jgi:hypothetical protein